MQNLRRLTAALLLLAAAVAAAEAASLRVTTWNLNWFPSGSPDRLAPEREQRSIEQAGAILAGLDSDVIVLQEVRDWDAAERLAQALGENYQAVICSRFPDERTGAPAGRQLAILSRLPVESSWADRWRAESWLHPAGGHVFAAVRVGDTLTGVFGVHLKNNLTPGDLFQGTQLNILQREVCVDQLLSQIEKLDNQQPGAYGAFVIAGNFNTCRDQAALVSERTVGLLHESGFRSGFEQVPLVARVTCPGRGRYPDATFDYIWSRDAVLDRPPLITAAALSDHHPVTCELRIEPRRRLLPPEEQAAGAAPSGPASTPWRWWLPAGLLALAGLLWLATRSATRPSPAAALPLAWNESPSGPPTAADGRTDLMARPELRPFLARLMSEKLVRRLFWQRQHLVENQQLTASQVAQLEQRLTQLQPRIQARLEAYEKRIAELEHELHEQRKPDAALPAPPSGAA